MRLAEFGLRCGELSHHFSFQSVVNYVATVMLFNVLGAIKMAPQGVQTS